MTIFPGVIVLVVGTASAVAPMTVTTTLWANFTCYVRPGLKWETLKSHRLSYITDSGYTRPILQVSRKDSVKNYTSPRDVPGVCAYDGDLNEDDDAKSYLTISFLLTDNLFGKYSCITAYRSVDGKEKEKSTSLIIDGSLQQESEGFKATKSFAHWVKVTWPHQKMSPETSAIVKRYASNNRDKEQHLLTCRLQVDKPSCHHDSPDVLHHQLSYAQKEASFILNLLVTNSTDYECAVYTTIHNGTESTSATCPADQRECWSTWLYLLVSILVAAVTVILDRLFLRDRRTQLQDPKDLDRCIRTLSPSDRLSASDKRRRRERFEPKPRRAEAYDSKSRQSAPLWLSTGRLLRVDSEAGRKRMSSKRKEALWSSVMDRPVP